MQSPRSARIRKLGAGPRPGLVLVLSSIVALGLSCAIGISWPYAVLMQNTAGGTANAVIGQASPEADPRLAEVSALLRQRATALRSGRSEDWLAGLAPSQPSLRASQIQLFTQLTRLPFSKWEYRILGTLDPTGPQTPVVAWRVKVELSYQLAKFDRRPSSAQQWLTFALAGTKLKLTAITPITDGVLAGLPWDTGQIRHVQTGRVFAFGSATEEQLKAVAAQAEKAITGVSRSWGKTWGEQVVVILPATQAEFGTILARPSNGLDQVAAVTTGELTPGQPAAGNDRVVLNPAAFTRLQALGRQVVLTHELTHIAVRASTTQSVPLWLAEGFADYVAYRNTEISPAAGASDVLAQVRAGSGPSSLPTSVDFDPNISQISQAYSGAWLACGLLAKTYGEPQLVAFYRQVATGPAPSTDAGLAQAFSQRFGVTVAQFTADWRRYLASLAQ